MTNSALSMAVVMPVRNYAAAAMKRCIESLRRQEADPTKLDILIADYGSSPKEAAAVKELAANTGARYVWFDEKGPWNRSRAINLGVRATTAPIIVTSDADLVFDQNFTRTVLGLAEKYAGGEIYAYAPMMDLPENLAIDLNDYEADYARLLTVAKERIWSRGNVIFSRTLFERIRGWEEAYEIWGCEDNDFFDRAKRSGAAVVDLKGVTSYLHHWHVSNKRGAEAAAQVARNQVMCWPAEGRAAVRRTGPLAGDAALAEHKPFQLPSVAILITGASDIAKADVTRGSIAAQTYREVRVVPVTDPATLSATMQRATQDVVGLMQAGEVFAADDALAWRVLIPLLKGETPQMSFMWRRPSEYTGERQIAPAGATPSPPVPQPVASKALFGNYGATATHSMSEPAKAAMLFSRAPIRNDEDLAVAVSAEKTIGEMNDADYQALQAQRKENPGDPYFDFWMALAQAHRGAHKAAYEKFAASMQAGLNHWRVAWALAQSAAKIGDVAQVDNICGQLVKLMPKFWFARELPKHARGHYAQSDQEQVIERFFRERPPRAKVFVEVGGFDGVHYSNVRRLQETHGWTGMSVEPVAKNFAKLFKSYAGRPVACVRAAVGSDEGEAELHVSTYPHLPDWGSDVATFVPKRRDEWVTKFGAEWVTERVPIKRLTRLLEEQKIARFDLLSVDVEGHDLSVVQSLDFERYRPQLIVIEYGADRAPILAFLTSQGYALYHDNNVDLFMADAKAGLVREDKGTVSRDEAAKRLNPHLVSLVKLPEAVSVVRLAPTQLLDARRFDTALKYLYAEAKRLNVQSDFARRAYLAHIGVFNGFKEGDQSGKQGPEAFVAAFDQVIASVAAKGFDPAFAVPIDRNDVVVDGVHRVAACIAYNEPVTCLQLPTDSANYDYAYFRDRTKFAVNGLEAQYADAAALAYAKLKTNTHIVNLFPAAVGRDADVEATLKRYARIVYAKHAPIAPTAAPLLMRQMYENESWLGDWSSGFRGAQNKGGRCFDGEGPVRVYLIETDTPEKLRACKEEIRALYQIGAAKNGQDAVHINDTHAETVLLARIYFNANSIAFLNSAKPQAFDAFNQQFARYRDVLKSSRLDTDHFCIEGSAIMAAYGIRASRDLDYLSLADVAPDFGTKLVGNHASELKHHVLGRDQIIFDPANHFYFFGLKIATLDVLRGMKAKRAEKPKDFNDLALIDAWPR